MKPIEFAHPNIPTPVAGYIEAANAQDSDAVTACFRGDAVVHDEGRDWIGASEIRRWAAGVIRKYHPTLEVVDSVESDGRTAVTGRVAGDFPGSPVELRYVFTLRGDKIARLEIS